MTHLSRRRFVGLAAAGIAAKTAASGAMPAGAPLGVSHRHGEVPRGTQLAAPARLTAQQLIDRVKVRIGVPWLDDTLDGVLAGHPATLVSGVVTTSMATLDVLQQAVGAGANLVITAAPAFYAPDDAITAAGAREARTTPQDDPVIAAKRAFIAKHGLVVFRLARHWHLRVPDPRALGLASLMGWTGPSASDGGLTYEVPDGTLETLARQLASRLGIRGSLRAIGHRALPVRRIGLLPGVSRIEAAIAMLPHVDAIVTGEVWEWETAAYVQDVVYAGVPKGCISIGRVVNEAPGMQVCADWLSTIVPEVPVRFISAGDPYWRPR